RRSLETRQASRWPLWRCCGRRVFWRIDVSPRYRCLQDCARGAGGAFARTQIRVAGYAMAYPAPATIWRYRNFAEPLPAPPAESGRIASEVSVATDLWPIRFGRAGNPLSAVMGNEMGAQGVTCPTSGRRRTGPWLQIEQMARPAVGRWELIVRESKRYYRFKWLVGF